MSEHKVLARKYRPQGFDEVVGQPAVSVTLKNALSSKRLHHAYLFTGPRGVGKTTMARILAKALNCAKGPTPEPCGKCDPCTEIAGSSSLDVLEMDAASNTSVDNVRQAIIETVALAPSRDRYKVFIIDETHMLSSQAFNALLKTIEEPPPHVVFILATTELAKVPPTIASRCQRFRFRPVPVELLAAHLADLAKREKLKAEPAALELLARNADGSLRDAVSLLDQCRSAGGGVTEELVRDMFGLVPQELLAGLAKAILARDAKALGGLLKTLHSEGVEASQLLRDLRSALEALYLQKLGVEAVEGPLTGLEASAEQLSFLLRRLGKTLEEMRFGDSPRLTLELGLFGCLEAAGDLEAWVKRLEALESRLSSGAAAAPAPASAYRQAPPQASTPAPVPAAAPSAASGGWGAVLEAIRAERAALAATLEKARVETGADAWTLRFATAFELTSAERGRALIEAKMATILGKTIKLSLLQGQSGHTSAPSEIVAPAVSSTPAPQGSWSDASEGEVKPKPASDPGLSKAQQILGGKVRIVKKPQA